MSHSTLQKLEVTIGNTVNLSVTSDLEPTGITADVVDTNLTVIHSLSASLTGTSDGLYTALIVLTPAVTLAARDKGTLMQIAWDFSGEIQNTRINLVGVLESGDAA